LEVHVAQMNICVSQEKKNVLLPILDGKDTEGRGYVG